MFFLTGKKRNVLYIIGENNVTVYSIDIDENLSDLEKIVFNAQKYSNS